MTTLSGKTLNRLIKIARYFPRESIQDLLLESEVCEEPPRDLWGPSAYVVLTDALFAARKRAKDGDTSAHKALLAFATDLVRYDQRPPWEFDEEDDERWGRLKESLRSDGYELLIAEKKGRGWDSGGPYYSAQILPYDSDAAPLHRELTALQEELQRRGYVEAASHYAKAMRHLIDQVPTSANAELRNALESLVIRLAVDHTGYQDTGRANQGGNAIKTLYVEKGQPPATPGAPLPENDGGRMVAGIWNILHSRGSHPGSSDAREARIRMQLVTGLALFLLSHFPKKS
ncbi:hypothetical protein ACFVXH_38410 [Kitasatospora sp. NPDC058184]|uniref:hypothetical protein n=1 Tax=Kitasatospora sp. NPDC058184 TaxID=3346370 RepID=UPI0036DD04B7